MNIAEQVKLVISKSLAIPVDQLTDETRLEDLGAQSIDVIEMVFELEDKFDIEISLPSTREVAADNLEKGQENLTFSTVGDVFRAVNDLVDAKASR